MKETPRGHTTSQVRIGSLHHSQPDVLPPRVVNQVAKLGCCFQASNSWKLWYDGWYDGYSFEAFCLGAPGQ